MLRYWVLGTTWDSSLSGWREWRVSSLPDQQTCRSVRPQRRKLLVTWRGEIKHHSGLTLKPPLTCRASLGSRTPGPWSLALVRSNRPWLIRLEEENIFLFFFGLSKPILLSERVHHEILRTSVLVVKQSCILRLLQLKYYICLWSFTVKIEPCNIKTNIIDTQHTTVRRHFFCSSIKYREVALQKFLSSRLPQLHRSIWYIVIALTATYNILKSTPSTRL